MSSPASSQYFADRATIQQAFYNYYKTNEYNNVKGMTKALAELAAKRFAHTEFPTNPDALEMMALNIVMDLTSGKDGHTREHLPNLGTLDIPDMFWQLIQREMPSILNKCIAKPQPDKEKSDKKAEKFSDNGSIYLAFLRYFPNSPIQKLGFTNQASATLANGFGDQPVPNDEALDSQIRRCMSDCRSKNSSNEEWDEIYKGIEKILRTCIAKQQSGQAKIDEKKE